MSDGIHIDIDGWMMWADDLTDKIIKAGERGAMKAALQLLNDATMEAPGVPLDEGTLRGSGSAFVNNKLVAVNPPEGGNPTPATEDNEAIPEDAFVAVVGFNTPYAAYQHEGERRDGTRKVQNYSHSGTGAKFLERKMAENFDDYQAIVGREIQEVIGR